jgi:leader peptidase (prepilin peptidase) / N-methyltransferase
MRLDELTSLLGLNFIRGVVLVFGLLWGSFLNVVIYRVPREMSVVRPGSHCPGCGKPIAGYDNIPVLSFLILRGRARCCKTKMSPRYPLVELIGGVISLAIFEVLVWAMLPHSISVGRAAAIYLANFSLAMALVAAAFIDAEHMFLPDSITFGGIVVGVVTATLRGMAITESLIGGVVGFAVVYVPFIFLYKGLLGRTGMGMGDAKLLALAGAWYGWPGAVFTLFVGALQGTLYAGITRALGIKPKLPDAVIEDIKELEKAAREGDEEAQKALLEDPLTEDESDAFIIKFFRRVFGGGDSSDSDTDSGGEHSSGTGTGTGAGTGDTDSDSGSDSDFDAENSRARIPFGPFLILAILELMFAGEWLRSHITTQFWPIF